MPDTHNPIATTIIYEDEHVRVWNQVVPEGSEIPKHKHENDYFLLNITGDGPMDVTIHDEPLDEQPAAADKTFSFSPKPREALFVHGGQLETAVNLGNEFRAILVEFKEPSAR